MAAQPQTQSILGALAVGAAAGALAGVTLTLAWRSKAEAKKKKEYPPVDPSVEERLRAALVVPVVALPDAAGAAALASALLEGGLPVIEVVFRTAAAEEAVRRIAASEPEVLVGAGTILTKEQAQRAVDAGARFIVSPGLNPEVVQWCQERGVLVVPGVATPTEVEKAMRLGLSMLKFFPAEANGGVSALKAICAPYGKLTFMPTGGVSEQNLEKYLSLPQVACCGGTWMVPQDAIAQSNWRQIKELSQSACALANSVVAKKKSQK